MTDTMRAPDRSVPRNPPKSSGWFLILISCVVLILVGYVSFRLGVRTGDREVEASNGIIKTLQDENHSLTDGNKKLQSENSDLKSQLDKAQTTLAGMTPSPGVYEINPNAARFIPYGHLTIGLVGAPGSDSVNLLINGKQYPAKAGQVIDVPVQQTESCRVAVMAFDVLKAQAEVNAVCVETKQ